MKSSQPLATRIFQNMFQLEIIKEVMSIEFAEKCFNTDHCSTNG